MIIKIEENIALLRKFLESNADFEAESDDDIFYHLPKTEIIIHKYDNKATIITIDPDTLIELLRNKGYDELAEMIERTIIDEIDENLSRLLVWTRKKYIKK